MPSPLSPATDLDGMPLSSIPPERQLRVGPGALDELLSSADMEHLRSSLQSLRRNLWLRAEAGRSLSHLPHHWQLSLPFFLQEKLEDEIWEKID